MTERLLTALRARANRRGLVLARSERLTAELHCSPEALESALKILAGDGKLDVLSSPPYLVVALRPRSWPGSNSPQAMNPPQISSHSRPSQEEVPVNSSFAAAAIQSREVGGPGEGGRLLEEVLAALGPDARREEFTAILRRHSPTLIRKCLHRVQATRQIRVSKAALFRALLEKLSR
jgi:hypothetical protein